MHMQWHSYSLISSRPLQQLTNTQLCCFVGDARPAENCNTVCAAERRRINEINKQLIPRALWWTNTDDVASMRGYSDSPSPDNPGCAASTTKAVEERRPSEMGKSELSMGPFLWPDPTQPISWLTQPNPLQVEKCGPNPTQSNIANNGAYSLVVTYFYTQNLSVSGTCQIGRKIKFNCLVQPNHI